MKILIAVSGGVVQAVYCDSWLHDALEPVEVHVRDEDNIEAGEPDNTADEMKEIGRKEYQVY